MQVGGLAIQTLEITGRSALLTADRLGAVTQAVVTQAALSVETLWCGLTALPAVKCEPESPVKKAHSLRSSEKGLSLGEGGEQPQWSWAGGGVDLKGEGGGTPWVGKPMRLITPR